MRLVSAMILAALAAAVLVAQPAQALGVRSRKSAATSKHAAKALRATVDLASSADLMVMTDGDLSPGEDPQGEAMSLGAADGAVTGFDAESGKLSDTEMEKRMLAEEDHELHEEEEADKEDAGEMRLAARQDDGGLGSASSSDSESTSTDEGDSSEEEDVSDVVEDAAEEDADAAASGEDNSAETAADEQEKAEESSEESTESTEEGSGDEKKEESSEESTESTEEGSSEESSEESTESTEEGSSNATSTEEATEESGNATSGNSTDGGKAAFVDGESAEEGDTVEEATPITISKGDKITPAQAKAFLADNGIDEETAGNLIASVKAYYAKQASESVSGESTLNAFSGLLGSSASSASIAASTIVAVALAAVAML